MNFFTKKKKNYIILALIYLATIILVLYLASWYNTYQAYKKEIPVLENVVSVITPNEVDHFIMENPSTIIYFCKASDNTCRSFEKSIKDDLESLDKENLTYVNLESVSDLKSYLTNFLNLYHGTNYDLTKVPALIKLTDGKITAIEQGDNNSYLTKDEAINFLKRMKGE
mgnify:CR=1 FL=1